jgi:ankyrin repeat protein
LTSTPLRVNQSNFKLYFFNFKLLHAEWLAYLKRENKSNFDQFKNYYIPRNLKRFIQIDRNILHTAENKDELIIVHTEEEFNAKCHQNPEKNIHYLQKEGHRLLWQKSSGSISSLNEYFTRKDEFSISIGAEEILNQNNENILIISAESGMGKSVILDYFVENSNIDQFCLKITLNSCRKALKNFANNLTNNIDALDFIFKYLLKESDELKIKVLKYFAKNEKLILMFDGLDEVNDCTKQAIDLIAILSNDKSYKLKKILITARNHLEEELDNCFQTVSFHLSHFNDDDQKNFLYNLNIKSVMSERLNQFMVIPLQAKMLADLLIQNDTDFLIKHITNIADLYGEFIECKIKIQPKRESFYLDHAKLSSSLLLFENNQEKALELSEEEILEYGIVVRFTDKTPTFLHQSFAEFFVAKRSINRMEQSPCYDDDKELEQIMKDKRHLLVRKFLNGLMKIEQIKINLTPIIKDYKIEIENCCRENLISLLKYFLERHQAHLEIKKEYLIIASQYEHKEIVDYLIEKGGYATLMWAIENGHTDSVRLLIAKAGINVNQLDRNGFTTLMWASKNGHKAIVQMLVEHKDIDVNIQDQDGLTALLEASKNGHTEIVHMLLESKDINVNLQCKNGFTALMWASRKGHKKITQMLLEYKDTDVNIQDRNCNSPLVWAAENGHKDIVQMLLKKADINVNQKNRFGSTMLMWAVKNGHKEIVQMLLQDKNLEINQQDENGYTPLIMASRESHKEIVQMLLGNKDINVNVQNKYGFTALMWAIDNGHKELVQMFIAKARINVNQLNSNGFTTLTWASRKGHKEIVQQLVEHEDIDLNIQDKYGSTALMWASENGHKTIVQMFLLDKNINVNHQDKDGSTALILASRNGRKEIVQMLLQDKNVQINHHNKFGNSALVMASTGGHKEIVQILLEIQHINANQQDQDGFTSLMWASRNGHKEIVQMLLEKKDTNVNQLGKDGSTALMWASRNGHKEIVQILLGNVDINVNKQDNDGFKSALTSEFDNNEFGQIVSTALIEASKCGHIDIVQILLDHKDINVNLQCKNGFTALMWASRIGHKEVVHILSEHNDIKVNQKNMFFAWVGLVCVSKRGAMSNFNFNT